MKNEKKWKEVKKYRDMNMEIEKGIGNGTESEGGRLGALLSTTACSLMKRRIRTHTHTRKKFLLQRLWPIPNCNNGPLPKRENSLSAFFPLTAGCSILKETLLV